MLWCPGYEAIGKKSIILHRPYIVHEGSIIGQLLLNERKIPESKERIYELGRKEKARERTQRTQETNTRRSKTTLGKRRHTGQEASRSTPDLDLT